MDDLSGREVYEDSYEVVPVDQVGTSSEALGMHELCYCAGVISYNTETISAVHLTPGDIGEDPEELLEDLRGEKHMAVLGVQVDKEISEIVNNLDLREVYQDYNFVATPEGELFRGRKEMKNTINQF